MVQAEAELERARQTLGPKGDDNPQIRDAMAVLAQANLDLQRTTVFAPSEGGVTNLSLGIGQVLSKGEAAMTYIDIREVWIEAAFREVSLENIHVGDRVEIVLDLCPAESSTGVCRRWGMASETATSTPAPACRARGTRAAGFARRSRCRCASSSTRSHGRWHRVSARRPRSWCTPAAIWS